jgi:ubiquinone/menaquinone biosynthesis C-methylase UbiE
MNRRVHDSVAAGYNSGSGIIADKNREVAANLGARLRQRTGPLAVADLGVGDGAMLAQLAALGLPLKMTGLDVSAAMLRLAAARVPLSTVHAPAQRAREVLPAAAFDVVLAHFILAYVDRFTLLEQVRDLLAPGGVLSLVTTTEEGGGPFFEGLDRFFHQSRNPIKRAIGRVCDRAIAQSHVPESFATLEADIHAAGLVVLRRETMRQHITFNDAAAAYRFGIEEGWAANFLAMPGVPVRAAQALARWGTRQATYPFSFTHVIEMLEIGVAASGTTSEPSPIPPHEFTRRPAVGAAEAEGVS